MKSFVNFRFGLVLASAVYLVGGAMGQTIVVPNAEGAIEGNNSTSTVGGPFGSGAFTNQFLWGSSHLGALSVGTKIYGIRFRLDGGNPTGNYPSTSLTWANYDVTFAQAATTVTTMSTNVAANMTAPVVVRSGSFTLAANSLSDTGSGPNPFGGYIGFTTPYTYAGGALVMLITHSAVSSGTGLALDATSGDYGSTWKQHNSSSYAPTTVNSTTAGPVVQLDMTAPVPEPASMLALGTGILALSRRRNALRRIVGN